MSLPVPRRNLTLSKEFKLGILLMVVFATVYTVWQSQTDYGFEVRGVDVSHHQRTIAWQKVRQAGISFAFMKATEGKNFVDKRFQYNWKESKRHGLIRGAYHFYRPAVHSSLQAEHFIRNVSLERGDLPPVLDLEVTDGRSKKIIVDGVRNWLRLVEAHYGVQPIIYVNRHDYHRFIQSNFQEYTVWIAAYSRRKPRLSDGKTWHFWQYTDRGSVQGVSGRVDLNFFTGSQDDLNRLRIR